MGIQDVIRFFLPKEDHFYEYLERQASLAHEAAGVAMRFAKDETPVDDALAQVEVHERAGDTAVREMEEALAKTFVTPIDREDLHRLSAQLDDVLDLIYETVRACQLLGVSSLTGPMKQMVELLAECTEVLADTLPRLREHAYATIVADARRLRDCEARADSIYREGISALFAEDAAERSARVLLREKTVLDDLERAIDHCDTVANTLTNLAVKHG